MGSLIGPSQYNITLYFKHTRGINRGIGIANDGKRVCAKGQKSLGKIAVKIYVFAEFPLVG